MFAAAIFGGLMLLVTIENGASLPAQAQGPTPTAINIQGAAGGGVPTIWARGFCTNGQVCGVGDFDGDGKDDILAFTPVPPNAGSVYVALSSGTSFELAQVWATDFCIAKPTCLTGDFNGDGRADIAAFNRNTPGEPAGHVLVALSDGRQFAPEPAPWSIDFCLGAEICVAGDLNGDTLDDLVAFDRTSGEVYVALSTGRSFTARHRYWSEQFCTGEDICTLGDVNGDGRADLVSFHAGEVRAALSAGVDVAPTEILRQQFCADMDDVCMIGDADGDGRADAVAVRRGAGYASAPLAGGTSVGRMIPGFCREGELCMMGNFDGLPGDDLVSFLGDKRVQGTPGLVYVVLSWGGPRIPRR